MSHGQEGSMIVEHQSAEEMRRKIARWAMQAPQAEVDQMARLIARLIAVVADPEGRA